MSFSRYGSHGGGFPSNILNHPFFQSLDLQALQNGTLVPEYVPEILLEREPITNTSQVKAYNGEQHLFAEF